MKLRKTQIIEAALDIISMEGIKNCTTRRLAEKVGVTEPALYRHFKNKDHILSEVCRFDTARSEKHISAVMNNEDIGPVEKLRKVFITLCEYFNSNPSSSAVIFSEEIFRDQDKLSATVWKTMQKRQQLLSNIIKEGQRLGEIDSSIDSEDMAFIFQGALRLLVSRWRLSKYNFDLKERGERLGESLLKLLSSKK